MRRSSFTWAVLVAAFVLIEVNWICTAPSHQTDDMLQTLLKLDRMYSSVARPRYVRSGAVTTSGMVPKVQRAINMLRLHHLDRLYADMARPRRGDPEGPVEVYPKVQRDIITLHQLDRMYADMSRPRFGKRGDANPNYPASPDDYESQFQSLESKDWLPVRR